MGPLNLNGYIPVRRGLLEHLHTGKMSLMEYTVYNLLLQLADHKTGIAVTNAGGIVYFTGAQMPLRTAQCCLRRLEEKGYIKRPFRVHGRRCYDSVFIDKFLCTEGALRDKQLSFASTTDWNNPSYVSRSELAVSLRGDCGELAPIQKERIENTSSSEQKSSSDSGDGVRKKTAKLPSQEAVRLAALLKSEILLNKPDYRITLQQERKWAETADRMLRLDGRTEEQIVALIRWVQADEFWRSNVLSMDKLREKFDALEMKRNVSESAHKTNGKANGNAQAQLDLTRLTPVEPMPTPNPAVVAMTRYKPNGGVKA